MVTLTDRQRLSAAQPLVKHANAPSPARRDPPQLDAATICGQGPGGRRVNEIARRAASGCFIVFWGQKEALWLAVEEAYLNIRNL